MNYELQILLGLNCNFKCSHCLNNSGPGNRDQDISDGEVALLFETIRSNKSIKTVSFSGGEPLLYISQIESLILKLKPERPDLKFSITTNGSLVEKNKEILEKLKIDYAMISFDKEHSEFISSDRFQEALKLSLQLFTQYEVNITYSDSPHYQPIKQFLLDNQIKVNFTQAIESGRNKIVSDQTESNTLTNFTCPNLSVNHISKVSYIPKKGFTICCGPIVFDRIVEDTVAYFETFSLLEQNTLYRFLKKAETVQVSTKSGNGCASCRTALKSVTHDELNYFNESKGWDNVLREWNNETLNHHNKLYNPKIIKKVEVGHFNDYLADRVIESVKTVDKNEGNNLAQSEIDDFSQFTIESFYDVHTAYYSIGDIARFKNDQKIFFNLPNKYIYHKIDGKIVGYLAVCEIENHPLFKVKAWHIGYWGMSQGLGKSERDLIKKDWAKLLKELNNEAIIAANIDYFNIPADRISEKFNLKPMFVRLDPRQ